MKTITMDFETYEKELAASESKGSRHTLWHMLRVLQCGAGELKNVFYTDESSSWGEIEIKDTAQKILDLFESQKGKN